MDMRFDLRGHLLIYLFFFILHDCWLEGLVLLSKYSMRILWRQLIFRKAKA